MEDADVHNPSLKVSAFITIDNQWNISALTQTLNDEPIINKIIGIPLPMLLRVDFFWWGDTALESSLLKLRLGLPMGFIRTLTWIGNLTGFEKLTLCPRRFFFFGSYATMPYLWRGFFSKGDSMSTPLAPSVLMILNPLLTFSRIVWWPKRCGNTPLLIIGFLIVCWHPHTRISISFSFTCSDRVPHLLNRKWPLFCRVYGNPVMIRYFKTRFLTC